MNHQVLARKWRPHSFTEIVGQEHVTQSLINALQHERLHHAYLFTGTRGVGKTTIARILAKAINCENLEKTNPCGKCFICRSVDDGNFLDLIEVDAASNTKVEDTRDLLDNAQYAPHSAKYKVYLIDEVHMLSGHSFNALLKTLEEPPEHVKFLLATTDPKKIPVTVLSRCLQFNLKRLSAAQISEQMAYILNEEQISFELSALQLLGHAADGSMRDGLSLLDQAIVYGNDCVSTVIVEQMLGGVEDPLIKQLLQCLATNNAEQVLAKIAEIAALSPDFLVVLQRILTLLHRLNLAKLVPALLEQDDDAFILQELSPLFSVEQLQLYYQIALMGQKDLSLAPQPHIGFEMVLLRMLAFTPQSLLGTIDDAPRVTVMPESVAAVDNEMKKKPLITSKQHDVVDGDHWVNIIDALNLQGLTKQLASHCVLDFIDEQQCQLLLAVDSENIKSERTEYKLEAALQAYYKKPLKLTIKVAALDADTPNIKQQKAALSRQQAAVDTIKNDKNIQDLSENFDGRVLVDTIKPV